MYIKFWMALRAVYKTFNYICTYQCLFQTQLNHLQFESLMLIETLQTEHTFHVVEMTEIRMEDGERERQRRETEN